MIAPQAVSTSMGRGTGADVAAGLEPAPALGAPTGEPAGTDSAASVGVERADPSGRAAERLAEVYAACWPHTVRFIQRQLRPRDWDAAEDLAQTTFLRAWPHLNKLPVGDDGAMHRWLSTIARHVVCDHYRKGPARQRAAETPVAPDSPLWNSARAADVVDEAAAVNERVDLAAAMCGLPADTRQVLRLRVLDDLPINNVARQLHRGRATVVRHTAAGLAALHAQLTEQAGPTRRRPEHHRTTRRPPLGVSLSAGVRWLDNPPPRGHEPVDRAGVDPTTAALTLRDYGAARWTLALRGLAAKTAEPYLAGWRQRVVPTLGQLPVRFINRAAVDRAVRSWIADECGQSTVKNSRAVLVRVLEQAVRDGILERNPATGLGPRPIAAGEVDTARSIGAGSTMQDTAGHDQPGEILDDDVVTPGEQAQPVQSDAADLTDSGELELAEVTGSVDLDGPEDEDYQACLDYLDEVYPPDEAEALAVPDQRTSGHQPVVSAADLDRADTVRALGRDAEQLARTRTYPQLRDLLATLLDDDAATELVERAAELQMARGDLRRVDEQATAIACQLSEFQIGTDRRVIGHGPLADVLIAVREQQLAATADPPGPLVAATAAEPQPASIDQPRTADPATGGPRDEACSPIGDVASEGGAAASPPQRIDQEPAPVTDAADRCAADAPVIEHVKHVEEADHGQAPRVAQHPAPVEETAAAVERARRALARMQQTRAVAQDRAGDAARVEQLARWHADDHAAEDEAADRYRELEGITR